MKAGKTVRTFSTRDGRQVILRTPVWDDLEDLMALINSLVEERANILIDEKVTREEEIDWLSKALSSLEKDEISYLVAQVDGNVIANSELGRGTFGCERHVGRLGIVIRNGFRNVGIGTEMMKALIEQARGMGLKVLTLSAFASNERARHVYQKVGFTEVGRIPRKFYKQGKYIDEILMAKVLE
jgi:RimJ/RimL family protein N-acetyltransferase